ncbi:MAG: FHA domain-containing protein [Candidatus Nanopelagicales bacterium]
MINECLRCGRPLEQEDRFCSACGTPRPREDSGDPTGVAAPDVKDTGPVPIVEGMSGLSRGMSVIVVQRGPEIGQRFELSGERLTVGRAAESDVMLDDVTVSRNHAEFVSGDDGWSVVDMGSLNGTYVNRASIERHRLISGDLIQIGKFRLQFLHADEDHLSE